MKIDTQKIKIIVSWLLVLLWAGVIFYLSSRTAVQSTVQSQGMINTFSGFLGQYIDDEETMTEIDGIVRESAHAVEYMILSILAFNALGLCLDHRKDKVSLYTIVFCMIYALSDEIHQIPIEGRAFEILDLTIDLIGTCIGVIALLVRGYLKNRYKKV